MPTPTPTLTRTAAGLLARVDFASPAGLTLGPGWSLDAAAPAMVVFDRSPRACVTAAQVAGTPCGGGVREFVPIIDTDGSWHTYVGAGDGSGVSPGRVWRPQLIDLPGRGVGVPSVVGDMGIGLYQDPADPGAGTYAARDVLSFNYFRGTYYLQTMISGNVTAAGVPDLPYTADCMTAASRSGPWALAGVTVASNPAAGTFDHVDAYTASVVPVFGSFANFYSGTNGAGYFNIGLAAGGATPAGPFAKTGAGLLPGPIKDTPENFKVFRSDALNAWVAICNEVNVGAGLTDHNRLYVSGSMTDWSGAIARDVQRISPADGTGAVGIAMPIYDCRAQAFVRDAAGYVPFVFDSDPTGTGPGLHGGRSGFYAAMEPAPQALHYLPATATTLLDEPFAGPGGNLAGYHGWTAPSTAGGVPTYADGVASLGTGVGATVALNSATSATDPTVSANLVLAQGCAVGLMLRSDASGSNALLFDFAQNTLAISLSVYEIINGSYNLIDSLDSAGAGAVGSTVMAKVVASGQGFAVYINGALARTTTGTGAIAGAGLCGLRNGSGGTGTRDASAFRVTAPLAAPPAARTTRALAHGSFVAEGSAEFPALVPGGYQAWDFLIQPSGDGYQLRLDSGGGGLSLWKSSGGAGGTPGAYIQLQAGSGTLGSRALFLHRLRFSASLVAGLVTVRAALDGEPQIKYSGVSGPSASGSAVGWTGYKAESRARLAHYRAGGALTIAGLAAGQSVVVRGPGSIPLEVGTASGPTYATTTINHYPAASVEVDGVELAIPGYLWGGDALAYDPGLAAGPATGYALTLGAAECLGGSAIRAVVALTGGSALAAPLVVTLHDTLGATISGTTYALVTNPGAGSAWGTITIAPGSLSGSATITPTQSGLHAIAATHTGGNGGMADPAPATLTVRARALPPCCGAS